MPLPQDDVSIPNAFVAGRTGTADMPRLGRTITSTCTGSPTLSLSNAVSIYGSLDLTGIGSVTGGVVLTLAGRTAGLTITSAGLSFPSGSSQTISAPGGTYTLADVFSPRTFNVNLGTFVTANFAVSAATFNSNVGGTRAITLGTSTVSLPIAGALTFWNIANTGGLTFSGASSTIDFTATDSGVTKTFAGAGLTYGTLRHIATGSAALTITGNNTFTALDLECTTARTITFPASGTQTITGTLTLLGAAGQLLSLRSSATPTKWYINAATTSAQYCDVKDCTATGTGTPIDNSTGGVDSGNNIGWLFVAGGTAGYSSTLLTLGVG